MLESMEQTYRRVERECLEPAWWESHRTKEACHSWNQYCCRWGLQFRQAALTFGTI